MTSAKAFAKSLVVFKVHVTHNSASDFAKTVDAVSNNGRKVQIEKNLIIFFYDVKVQLDV